MSSAIDIGNFAAGYILGRANILWKGARFVLDLYDSYNRSKNTGRLCISIKGRLENLILAERTLKFTLKIIPN